MIFHTTVPATPERLNNMHYHLIPLQYILLNCLYSASSVSNLGRLHSFCLLIFLPPVQVFLGMYVLFYLCIRIPTPVDDEKLFIQFCY